MTYKSKVATCTDEEFAKIVSESYTYKEVLDKLGYHHSGGAYITLRKRIKALNLSTEHMTPTKRYGKTQDRVPDEVIFVKGSTYCKVRDRVLKKNMLPYVCAICGQKPIWKGKPLTLTLDHINGDHYDNRIENLRFVCPNCDTQLDTYGAKNKKKYGITNKKSISKEPVSKKASNLVSTKVTKEEFLKVLKNFESFTELGRKFGVSDNAVRKWCRKWELPVSTNSMKFYVKNVLNT